MPSESIPCHASWNAFWRLSVIESFCEDGPAHMPPQQTQYYGPQFQQGGSGQEQQPYFQYSQCNGRKKALCVSHPLFVFSRYTLPFIFVIHGYLS